MCLYYHELAVICVRFPLTNQFICYIYLHGNKNSLCYFSRNNKHFYGILYTIQHIHFKIVSIGHCIQYLRSKV